MATIDTRLDSGNGAQAYQLLQRAAGTTSTTDKDKEAEAIKARLSQDIVTLSDNAQKIVNLNRGKDLSAEIKKAATDRSFADKLWKATQDIFRVHQVFRQTSRTMFGWWKRY